MRPEPLRMFPGSCEAPRTTVHPGEGAVLIAMNNPASPDPRLALFPAPSGVAGHRLLEMMRAVSDEEISVRDYLRAFTRVNLVDSTKWSGTAARARASSPEWIEWARRRDLIVLGRESAKSMGIRPREWGVWFHTWLDGDETRRPTRVCLLPHPSGRCRDYNDEAVRRLAGEVLLVQYRRVRREGKLAP